MSNLNIVDGIAVTLVALSVFTAYKRGFLRSAAGLLSLAFSIIFAKVLATPVANWIYTAFNVNGLLEKHITTYLNKNIAIPVGVNNSGLEFNTQLVTAVDSYVESLNYLKPFMQDNITNNPEILKTLTTAKSDGIAHVTTSLVNSFEPVIRMGIQVGCFLLLSLLAYAVLSIFTRSIANALAHLPLVGSLNHILGAVVGLISGGLSTLVFVGVLYAVVALFGSVWLFTPESLQYSYVFTFLTGVKLGL